MCRLTYLSLTIFLCLGGLVTASAQSRSTIENSLIDAVALYDSRHYDEALKILNPLASADPSNDAVFYYMALCSVMTDDVDNAETFFQEAVRLDPKNYWYRDWLARFYNATRRPELAIDIYESLARDFPQNSEIYYSLVNIYAQQGKPEKVLEILDEIETVQGPSEMVTMTRYDILRRMDKNREAYEALEAYNERFASAMVLSAMGDYNLSQYEDSLALTYYKEALACDSDCLQARIGIAETYRIKRSYPEFFEALHSFVTNPALDLYPKTQYLGAVLQHSEPQFRSNFQPQLDTLVSNYVALAPTDSLVLQTSGVYYFTTEREEKGIETISQAVGLYPGSFALRALYIQLLSDSGDWVKVVEECSSAYEAFPGETAFLEYKGIAHYNLKDYESVISNAEDIITAAAGDTLLTVQCLYTIGDMYHQMGASKKSYAAFERALKLNPTYAPVLNNYAYYLSCEGKKLKKAYAMSKITVDQEPDNFLYLDTLAWILYLQGKASEAKPFLKHAMLYGGKESATVLDHYAEVLYSLGEYDIAKVYWNLAVNKNTEDQVPGLEAKVKAKLEAVGK